MPDLESQIARWRRAMRASGIKASLTLDELEDHLRGDIDRRMQLGAGAQQAFEMASDGLGTPGTLRSEFQKLKLDELMNPATRRRATHSLIIIALIAIQMSILFPILHKARMYSPDNSTIGAVGAGDIVRLVVSAAICIAAYVRARKYLLKA